MLNLTIAQFNARLKDVAEIPNLLQGEGKGRITRDPEAIRQQMKRKKIKPPVRIK